MLEKSTYYILDAQGNQLSMYEHFVKNNSAKFYLTERNIYGSSRLGTTKDTINMFISEILPSYGILGNRTYELSNHLGNVVTVINDVKYSISDDNTTISGYEVGINGISDYSPFGAPLDGRTMGNLSRRGFIGMEKDDEWKGSGNSYDFGARMYDSRLGRWLSIDALAGKYPDLSPYNFVANSPLVFIDPDGEDAIITVKGNTITVSAKIHIYNGGKNKIDVKKIQKSIMKYWDKKDFEYKDGNKTYNVKFDIQVDEYTGNDDLKYSKNENFVHPQESGYRSKVISNFFGEWATGKGESTYAHEIGHFLGLADQYTDFVLEESNYSLGLKKSFSENVDLSHPKDDLMGATKRNKIKSGDEKVDQSAIDAIAKYALRTLKEKDSDEGRVILNQKEMKKAGYSKGLNPPRRDEWELNNRYLRYQPKN